MEMEFNRKYLQEMSVLVSRLMANNRETAIKNVLIELGFNPDELLEEFKLCCEDRPELYEDNLTSAFSAALYQKGYKIEFDVKPDGKEDIIVWKRHSTTSIPTVKIKVEPY